MSTWTRIVLFVLAFALAGGAPALARDGGDVAADAQAAPRGGGASPASAPAGATLASAPAGATRDAAAIAAYRAGDLAAARAAWLEALDSEPRVGGAERARILHDLGNVAFREGRALESVGWFTASLRLRPRDADTWANLEHARREAKLEPADRGDLAATLRRLLGAFTPAESRLLALAGLLAWAGTLAFEALRGGRAARWLALVGAAFALACASPWLHAVALHADAPALIVEEGKALVRSEPRADAAVVAEAPAGSEVEAVDALPGWSRIRVADGTEGWVSAEAVFALAR